jgi:hypothetical protein
MADMVMDARRVAKRITVSIREPRNAANAPCRPHPQGRDDSGASPRCRALSGQRAWLRRGASRCILNRLRRALAII